MVYDLSKQPSVLRHFVAEIRDKNIQQDRMRFRRNLERIGEVCGYELSKLLQYENTIVKTPLGEAQEQLLPEQPVLATILRAGLPLHQGLLNYFDGADNAFISAYRYHHKDHTFEVKVEYASCPPLDGRILILSDPMIATGTSLVLSFRELLKFGTPSQVFVVTAIASEQGVNYVCKHMPQAKIFAAAIDKELTAKAYIVPGLGDAGDLAFGEKK
jgi:uracil phosphoribosyltransferase